MRLRLPLAASGSRSAEQASVSGRSRDVRLYMHQLRVEQLLFWRSRELAFFTFLLPVIFLVLLGSAYGDEDVNGVRGYNYLLAGMLGYGAASTTFAGLGIVLVVRREAGTLKRLRATPLPARTYLAALFSSIILVYLIEAVILVALARIVFDVGVPDRLGSMAAAILVGAFSFTALGVGVSTLVKSAEGASAVINAIYLPATFVSGAFFSADSFPQVLQWLAEVLPLSHFIVLVRDITLHDVHVWNRLADLAVVAAWGAVGAIAAARGFRGEPREQ
jgi:ABC-2 type transport system permease protein